MSRSTAMRATRMERINPQFIPLRLVTAAVQTQRAGSCGPACAWWSGVNDSTRRTVSDGDSRGRANDGRASAHSPGHGDGSDDHGDSGRTYIRTPARRAEPQPPTVNNGLVTPRQARGGQKSPAEVAATGCQCERLFLPGKPQPFREEPLRASRVFSYARFDGKHPSLFGGFTIFPHFFVE